MGIPIEKSFVVKAPAEAVWEFLTDPARVASCLPGAAITGKEDGDTWAGTMAVKVGPVAASYRGKLRFVRLDPVAREAEIEASGQETRGKGGADMRMKSRVIERSPGETEVTVTSDVNVVGVLAQFGRGMIQDVSDQIFKQFTERMRRQLETAANAGGERGAATAGAAVARLDAAGGAAAGGGGQDVMEPASAPPSPAAPPVAKEQDVLDVGALGAAALGRAAGRTVRRPGFWIAMATIAAAAIAYWLATR